MPEQGVTADEFQTHRLDLYTHGPIQKALRDEFGAADTALARTWNVRFVELETRVSSNELRLTALEKWRERSIGAAGVLMLFATAGGLTVLAHLAGWV